MTKRIAAWSVALIFVGGCSAHRASTETPPSERPCRNLVPGCGSNPLPEAGCYLECRSDWDCPGGQRCETRNADPCADPGDVCEACGSDVRVCLP